MKNTSKQDLSMKQLAILLMLLVLGCFYQTELNFTLLN
jgi:hypothetical protein